MVYGICYCPLSMADKLKELGFAGMFVFDFAVKLKLKLKLINIMHIDGNIRSSLKLYSHFKSYHVSWFTYYLSWTRS
jgi:hypothetical protein